MIGNKAISARRFVSSVRGCDCRCIYVGGTLNPRPERNFQKPFCKQDKTNNVIHSFQH